MDYDAMIQYFMPFLATAGDYALAIQRRVQSAPDKTEGATAFSQALTDADLSIQNFIEVAALARFPDIAFDPEEAKASINLKYFSPSGPRGCVVFLDPVNGTKFYRDGVPLFDIILTVAENNEIVAAVTYVPARSCYFIGIATQGAYITTRHEYISRALWRNLHLSPTTAPLLTYRCPDSALVHLRNTFDVRALDRDYDPAQWSIVTFSILAGESCGFVKFGGVSVIDWGALAFIAKLAGGIVSDGNGSPIERFPCYPDRTIPSIVAASDAQTHTRILECIQDKNT